MKTDLFSSFLFIGKALLREKFLSIAPQYVKGRVLDIGCGKRPFYPFMPEAVTEYVGQDNNPDVKPDIVCDGTDIPVDPESFDTVLCNEVLEHVYKPQEVLQEIVRILKPGGYVYITVPMMWCLHYEPYDFWRYTPFSLRNLLEDAGLRVEKIERSGGLFSLVGQRFSDVFFFKWLFVLKPLPSAWQDKLATLFVLPLNITFYLLGKAFDWIDHRDALNWIVVAQKQ